MRPLYPDGHKRPRLVPGELGVGSLLVLVGLLAGCGSGAPPAPQPPSPPTVQVPVTGQMVAICWDGAQMQHTLELMRAGALPNLQALVNEGGFAATWITDHPTETMTGHAEMLTGYPPSVTGVRSLVESRPIPPELTVFSRAEQHYAAGGITAICVMSKTERLSSEPGKPWHEAKQRMDIWDGDVHRRQGTTGNLCLRYLQTYAQPGERFFCFFHFAEPDPQGHQHGENSPEYEAAIIGNDEWLGRIRQTLDDQGIGATTAVCVVTDHGFDEGKKAHKNARDAWLASNWAPIAAGDQRDLAPTLLTALGVAWWQLTPWMPGESLWQDRGAGAAALSAKRVWPARFGTRER